MIGKKSQNSDTINRAARYGTIDEIQAFISQKVDVNKLDDEGYSPLMCAAFHNRPPEILQLLVDAKADPNFTCTKGTSPLMWSTLKGSVESMKILIDAKADLDFLNNHEVSRTTALLLAAEMGSLEKVQLLVEAKAALDIMNEEYCAAVDIARRDDIVRLLLDAKAMPQGGWRRMSHACRVGKADEVKALLDAGYPLHLQDSRSQQPLLLATEEGHVDIAEMLVAARAQVNVTDRFGDTPLGLSVMHGCLALTKSLINAQADVNMGHCPLLVSLELGKVNIAKLLINARAQLNVINNTSSCTPLHYSLKYRNVELTKLLIDAQAPVNMPNARIPAPLLLCIKEGDFELTKLLIDAKAKVDACGSKDIPLTLSIQQGNFIVAKLLVDAKAQVNAKDHSGNTPLHYSITQGRLDLTRLLIDAHAQVNVSAGESVPLITSIFRGNIDVAKLLIDAKALVNVRQADVTPLIHSAQKNNFGIAKLLIEAQAQVNVCDKESSPLTYSIKHGNLEFAKLLIDSRADVNLRPQTTAATALHCTAERGDVNAARMLIDAKADLTSEKDDKTPLGCAAQYGRLDVMRLLLDANAAVEGGAITPLSCAASTGSEEAFLFLLDAKASYFSHDLEATPPIIHAITGGNSNIVKMFLAAKVDVSAPRNIREDALFAATVRCNTDIMTLLIDAKAPVERKDIIDNDDPPSQETPLYAAIKSNGEDEKQYAALKVLLDAKARVDIPGTMYARDLLLEATRYSIDNHDEGVMLERLLKAYKPATVHKYGKEALLLAYEDSVRDDYGDSDSEDWIMYPSDTLTSLVESKAPLDVIYEDDMTPLMHAVSCGRAYIAELLVNAKADMNCRDSGGLTPLMLAFEDGKLGIAKILIDAKAPLDAVDNSNRSALSYAIDCEKTRSVSELIKLLLDSKAPLDGPDNTLLHVAINRGRNQLARFLAHAKANVNAVNNDGDTPLMVAVQNCATDVIVKLLRANPASFDAQDKYGRTALMQAIINWRDTDAHASSVARMLLEHAQKHCANGSDDEPPAKRFKKM